MEEIDQFFSTIKQEYQQKRSSSVEHSSQSDDLLENFMDDLTKGKKTTKQDNLDASFTELQSQFVQQKQQQQVSKAGKNEQLDSLFGEVTAKFDSGKKSGKSSSINESKLVAIETEYQQKKNKIKVSDELNIAAIKEEELKKQREQKFLMQQAQQWLNKLDPYSDEGFWFEQFAASYHSRLEAAMDYLGTLNDKK